MAKKKPEMSQVHGANNEFIFGEHGGRGKHLLSFSKNLSLTRALGRLAARSDDDFREANSKIYGSLAYGYDSPDTGGSVKQETAFGRVPLRTLSGGLFSRTSLPHKEPGRDGANRAGENRAGPDKRAEKRAGARDRSATYTDLDDDWDADVKEAPPPQLQPQKQPPAPSQQLQPLQQPQPPAQAPPAPSPTPRVARFHRILADDNSINVAELRSLAWNGVPPHLRAVTWQVLLGYLPANRSRQSLTLARKRQEYSDGLASAAPPHGFGELPRDASARDSLSPVRQLYHQIAIDVKRTNPQLPLYAHSATQQSLRKILFLWAVRHPASGYVQGINDLCTPFYQIFVGNYLEQLQRHVRGDHDPALEIAGILDPTDELEQKLAADPLLQLYTVETLDTALLSPRATAVIEADTYWCLSRLLDNITDNYIHEQPGILRQVGDLRSLIAKIDLPLLQHLDAEGVEFLQFSFRWMNCLLMRELSLPLIIRMWDTYLSETPLGFNNFHVYVCAAFLIKFSAELRAMDFQEILLFLQNTPTSSWQEKDIELMLSEAFIWQSLYKNATAHLR